MKSSYERFLESQNQGSFGISVPEVGEPKSAVEQVLGVFNRPYSTVMGGLYGLASGEGAGTDAWKGLSGEKFYGVADFAKLAGADPDSKMTRYGSMVADILNPLDPLAWVTLGMSKAGKIAKAAGEGIGAIESMATASRAAAAQEGVWNLLRFAGKPLTTKAMDVKAAEGLDWMGNAISGTSVYKTMARHFGGVEKFSAAVPGLSSLLRREKTALDMDVTSVSKEMAAVRARLIDSGEATEEGADEVLKAAATLIEGRYGNLASVKQRQYEVEAAAYLKDPDEYMPHEFMTDSEVSAIHEFGAMDQATLHKELGFHRSALEDRRRVLAANSLMETEDVLARGLRERVEIGKAMSLEHAADAPRLTLLDELTRLQGEAEHLRRADPEGVVDWESKLGIPEAEAALKKATDSRGKRAVRSVDAEDVLGNETRVYEDGYMRSSSTDEALLQFRRDVRRGGISVPGGKGGVTLEDFGNMIPGIWTKHPRAKGWDVWAEEAANRGLLPRNAEPSAFSELFRGATTTRSKVHIGDLQKGADETFLSRMRQAKDDFVVGESDLDTGDFVFSGGVPHLVTRHGPNVAMHAGGVRSELGVWETMNAQGMVKKGDEFYPAVADAWRATNEPILKMGERDRAAFVRGLEQERWKDSAPGVRQVADAVIPKIEESYDTYMRVLRQYSPDAQMPIEGYVKHMFPKSFSKWKQWADNLGQKSTDRPDIFQQLAAVAAHGKEADWRKARTYEGSIGEINAAAKGEGRKLRFESNTLRLTDSMYRDAKAFEFEHGIQRYALDNGHMIDAAEWGALSKPEQANWVQNKFTIPWIDVKKDPFAGKYVRREAAEIMASQQRAFNFFATDDALNSVVELGHMQRRWWSAWTLSPFPSFHVRNLASDAAMALNGGLNPVVDLMKVSKGDSSYAASMALNMARNKVPFVGDKYAAASEGSLQKFLAQVSERYGVKVDSDSFSRRMTEEGVIGDDAYRDIDMETVFSSEKAVLDGTQNGWLPKLGRWVPFRSPEKSGIVETGYKVGAKIQDFTKTALFIDSMKQAMANGVGDLEKAYTFASHNTRKYLLDYRDLTDTERRYMKLMIPFYTFTAKNLPNQIETMLTQPGRVQWANRMFGSMWGQAGDGFHPADMPDFFRAQLGLPMHQSKDKDGNDTWSVWSPQGWLPVTELNEMGDFLRQDGVKKMLMSRIHPVMKEGLEQLFNTDSFTGKPIDSDYLNETLGMPAQSGVPARAKHILRNVRLITELDRLNPGGMFTEFGRRMGWWKETRPHRNEAPEGERWVQFLTGMNFKGVNVEKEAQTRAHEAAFSMQQSAARARQSFRNGQYLEGQGRMEDAQEKQIQMRSALERLNRIRQSKAVKLSREWGQP